MEKPSYPVLRVPLQVKKLLKNGTLKAGAFTFQLKDSEGKLLAEVTNAADGSVIFPERTFTKEVSNYLYTVHEVAGNDKKITYDQTIYTVKVTTRAVNGQLQASVNLLKNGTPYAGEMVFENQRRLPSTGDSALPTALLILASSLLVLGFAWQLGKKKSAKR